MTGQEHKGEQIREMKPFILPAAINAWREAITAAPTTCQPG
jgi:hypothetical protein